MWFHFLFSHSLSWWVYSTMKVISSTPLLQSLCWIISSPCHFRSASSSPFSSLSSLSYSSVFHKTLFPWTEPSRIHWKVSVWYKANEDTLAYPDLFLSNELTAGWCHTLYRVGAWGWGGRGNHSCICVSGVPCVLMPHIPALTRSELWNSQIYPTNITSFSVKVMSCTQYDPWQ